MEVDKDLINRIKSESNESLPMVIGRFVSLQHHDDKDEGVCPKCHEHHFAVRSINGRYDYVCEFCKFHGNDALNFVMESQETDFTTAIKQLGDILGICVSPTPESVDLRYEGTFCHNMLRESGLTEEDVTAEVFETDKDGKKKRRKLPTFVSGNLDMKGDIIAGDEVVIKYFDLDGNPVQFEQKNYRSRTEVKHNYYRVRWQYPNLHLNKDGKPFKYKSLAGSGTPIYIPQSIRKSFQEQTEISRLFIQEGEKKAEKACKHGIPSIAISGIMNLGSSKDQDNLPEDFIRIIRDCQVKEVIFLMDSDWQDLSREKKLTESIEKRPLSFYYAARNFKERMTKLKNDNFFVEIYVGHVISHNGDKGIDDLLAHTLIGREEEMIEDLNRALNDQKNPVGTYCELFKITTLDDLRLKMIWGLDSVTSFAERHRDELEPLPEFIFGRHKYKIGDDGKPVFASPLGEDEKFWDERRYVDRNGNPRSETTYQYINGRTFLENHGYGRYRRSNGSYQLIKIDAPFVEVVQPIDARDYVIRFADSNCSKAVREMLAKAANQYLGPDHLSQLHYVEPNFIPMDKNTQHFFFENGCWRITQKSVETVSYSRVTNHVWLDQKKPFSPEYKGKLIEFIGADGYYEYRITDLGRRCHFLQFLKNCSNFTHGMRPQDIKPREEMDNKQHLLSKLCAIGYLALDAKDSNQARAVVAMDGQQSDIGASNGRTGKSLVGELIKHITSYVYIDGKKANLLDDPFVWHGITESTKFVFIDDVRQNFNFEALFPCITGEWAINYKHGDRISIPFKSSPKIYISTNHAIKGEGISFTERQWLLGFSDYYNQTHRPADDFDMLFFSEWDYEQWNLTWNLIANCIQLYLQFGVVEAPTEVLERRKLLADMTEDFVVWADEYFNADRLDVALKKSELQEAFFRAQPEQRKYMKSHDFKRRIQKYCKYRGYTLNPQMYDPATGKPRKTDPRGKPLLDHKIHGVEYFTIGTQAAADDKYVTIGDVFPQLTTLTN